jgi:hypothetical protein
MINKPGVTRDQIDSAVSRAAELELTDDQVKKIASELELTESQRKSFDAVMEGIDRIWSELLNKDIQIGNTKVEVGCVLPASDEHREDQVMNEVDTSGRSNESKAK